MTSITKTKLYWPIIVIAFAIFVIYFIVKIKVNTSFNFDSVATVYLILLIEFLFYGIFFRIYDIKFFKENWNWNFFLFIIVPLSLTSAFYFFQSNIYFTYFMWLVWVIAIVLGHFFVFDSDVDKNERPWQIFLTIISAVWITGFAFPELGAISYLESNFTSKLIMQIPVLRWLVDVRIILSLVFVIILFIKPFFSMNWTLEKFGIDAAIPEIPDETNTFKIILQAIKNGIKRANNYLNKIVLNLKVLAMRYWSEFITVFKRISLRTYSILLMTVTLISAFVLSRIAHVLAVELLSLLNSSTIFGDAKDFILVIVNTFLIYFILLLNWLLFNKNIFFAPTSITRLNRAIWFVFNEYLQILLVKIPGFIFIVLVIGYISALVYNTIVNKPVEWPGIYIILCLIIFIGYLIYSRFKRVHNKGTTASNNSYNDHGCWTQPFRVATHSYQSLN